MRGGLCAVTAKGHTAPSPGVGLRFVEEEQDAGLPLAGADQSEVFIADQVGDSLRERLQELLGSRPSPNPLQTKVALVGGRCVCNIATGAYLPETIAPREQVIQRA